MKDVKIINGFSSTSHLPTIPGGWKTEEICLASNIILLTSPATPDDLLEDEYLATLNAASITHLPDEGAPYWAHLWDAAKTMATFVLKQSWDDGAVALELGSGIGLVGIAALKAGLQTTLSDYDPTSIQLAKQNTTQNGFPQAEVIPLQWEFPLERTFPVILGCEIIYEPQSHLPLINLLDTMLASNGTCWLGDGGRRPAAKFIELATSRGYHVSLTDANNRPLDTLQYGKFQLLQIQRS